MFYEIFRLDDFFINVVVTRNMPCKYSRLGFLVQSLRQLRKCPTRKLNYYVLQDLPVSSYMPKALLNA